MAVLIERADLSRHYVAVLGHLIYDPLFDEPVTMLEYTDQNSSVISVQSEGARRRTALWPLRLE